MLYSLKNCLDELLSTIPLTQRVEHDPVRFVHRYEDPRDREVVGLLASGIAYGRVMQIGSSLERLLTILGPHPHRFDPLRESQELAGFIHRFTRGKDVAFLLDAVRTQRARHGSLEKLFSKGFSARDRDIGPALSRFVRTLLEHDPRPTLGGSTLSHGASHFLPDPLLGSACKRLCLFLRWMVRPADGVDIGLWQSIPPSALVIPLDTHLHRIGLSLGLTLRKNADWRAALEVTDSLRELDPTDPTKYDFALCHMGISGLCRHRRDENCRSCPLRNYCLIWQKPSQEPLNI